MTLMMQALFTTLLAMLRPAFWPPWSKASVNDRVSWKTKAWLCRRSGVRRGKPVELFRGELADAVCSALKRPEEERARLFICCEGLKQKLNWAAIVQLSAEPDFPISI